MTAQQEGAPADAALAPAGPVRACPDWLTLRREADTEARDAGAGDLLAQLVGHLRGRAGVLRVVDVGAGTGANHAYLSPRLPFEQSWVVVDHDADLLAHAGHGDAVRIEAGVGDLVEVLDGLDLEDADAVLLTCTALLDVLTTEELVCLADAIERCKAPALLSLTVTGRVVWSPRDPADRWVDELFDSHQRRDGRAGPDAASVLERELRARGLTVVTASTPWLLDDRRPELLGRWLDERVEAAAARLSDGDGASHELACWHERRRQQLASAGLAVHVDHVDLLVLPY